MRVLVTAGPTREYIDTVRFITNASSGKMGYACTSAAAAEGHQVTLITGPVHLAAPEGCQVVRIVSVQDLKAALHAHFASCDALLMAAAVGDFAVQDPAATKLPRSGGPLQIMLAPTEDLLAGLGALRRPGQVLIGFAVEETGDEEKAYQEMVAKNCDYVVLNSPSAMGADASEACIISRHGIALPWARRTKGALAREIVALLSE